MRTLTESELDSVAGGATPIVALNAVSAGLAGLAAGPGINNVSIAQLTVTAPGGLSASISLLSVTAPGGLAFGASGASLLPTVAGQTPSIEIFAV